MSNSLKWRADSPALPDFAFANHGSICLLTPISNAATAWCEEHLPEDAQRWGACGIVVEPRYVADILVGIQADGLTVG